MFFIELQKQFHNSNKCLYVFSLLRLFRLIWIGLNLKETDLQTIELTTFFLPTYPRVSNFGFILMVNEYCDGNPTYVF